jgi:regulator of nucleoside diphosphate kinase
MHAVVHGERTLTDIDHARLSKLASRQRAASLAEWLESVEVTSSRTISADRVTMYSRVDILYVRTHRRQVLTICYPADAAPAAGFVSVLSPVGSSLLGLRTGDVARWRTPHGEDGAAQVTGVQYQPEANGDYAR